MSGVFIIFCYFFKVNSGVLLHNRVATLVSVSGAEQRWVRIRTGSGLKPILAGQDWIRLQFFSKLADQGWNGLRNFLLF